MMTFFQLPFTTLDVFTKTKFAGNQLAVVRVPVRARALITQEIKQRIAQEFNLSETVFIHDEQDESTTSRDIDIFTTSEEVPFAGHPTIGTGSLVLNELRWSHVRKLITKSGPIEITRSLPDLRKIKARVPFDVHIHSITLGDLLDKVDDADLKSTIRAGLSDDPIICRAEMSAHAVSIVKGMTFLQIELPSLEHLARVDAGKALYFDRVKAFLLDKGPWGKGFVARYYYVLQPQSTSSAVCQCRARMIEPGFEDPATGSAASSLASYLLLSGKVAARESGKVQFEIAQGAEIGRRSDISLEVFVSTDSSNDEMRIKELFLGGTAVVVMNGTIQL